MKQSWSWYKKVLNRLIKRIKGSLKVAIIFFFFYLFLSTNSINSTAQRFRRPFFVIWQTVKRSILCVRSIVKDETAWSCTIWCCSSLWRNVLRRRRSLRGAFRYLEVVFFRKRWTFGYYVVGLLSTSKTYIVFSSWDRE